jgi:hypothetical protein
MRKGLPSRRFLDNDPTQRYDHDILIWWEEWRKTAVALLQLSRSATLSTVFAFILAKRVSESHHDNCGGPTKPLLDAGAEY